MTETTEQEVQVRDATDASRYEIEVDGMLAGFSEYRLDGDVITFIHTEIEPAFGGQGLGSKLVGFAVRDARSRGRTIIPECPFVRGWMREHPEES
ncbi:MAG: N-acetyltransferase [Solirubrobacterales bacterium]|nr:N-acetyltransferase [Solirubrobacterales bacterium]MCB0860999.1 N-acetyltransferase [Solirubrobacterales bacterium]